MRPKFSRPDCPVVYRTKYLISKINQYLSYTFMPWRYYTSEELSVLLDIPEEDFHRKVKKMIKRDFKIELEMLKTRTFYLMKTL
jgi:hypothetical protein